VTVKEFYSQAQQFLMRRNGGIEVELLIAATEIWWGLALILWPIGLAQSQGLHDFYTAGLESWKLALPWLIAGSLNIIGFVLFILRRRSCAIFRFAGSTLSTFIWFAVFIKTGIILDWSPPFNGIYFFFSVWSIRLIVASVARYRSPDDLRWQTR
jgi:hypothetical protein